MQNNFSFRQMLLMFCCCGSAAELSIRVLYVGIAIPRLCNVGCYVGYTFVVYAMLVSFAQFVWGCGKK